MTNTETTAPEFTTTSLPSVKIGSQTFTVKLQTVTWTDNGIAKSEDTVWLTGARGGEYFLRPTRITNPTGVFQIISWKSGAALRVRGNEVRATMLGDIIETA